MHTDYRAPALLRYFSFGALFIVAVPLAAADKEPRDAPPQLISTTGGGPKWKNLKELQQLAAKGDPAACFELAGRLAEGNGVPKDFARARTLYEQAATGGVPGAWFQLGRFHHDEIAGAQDYARAVRCYLEAARRGVAQAQYNIGAMLVSARGVSRDYVEGLAWIVVAVKHGADPAGEKQVRARLANRTADIAAAEARAAEIIKNLATATVRGTFLAATDSAPAAVTPGSSAPPTRPIVTLPKPEPPPAKIPVAIGPVPAPPPGGKP
jgi:TPR repeat protein